MKAYNEQTEKTEQLQLILDSNPMFKSFRKYFEMIQEGKNDYEVGCIQATNALMPVIAELMLNYK